MKTVEQARTDVAAIVGRWQVDDLHVAHLGVISEMLKHHKKVIVLLGVTEVLGSLENPLDYPTRAAMIQEHYPQIVTLPLRDRISDEDWSHDLDSAIRTVSPLGTVTLYGGRDSFVKHYKGKFKCIELDALGHVSGTDIRKEVGREVLASPDFRAGVIYSTANQYPRLFMVVDIAMVFNNQILLGRKQGLNDWGLVGGFVDKGDKSLESAARREAWEETGLLPETLEYVGSFHIPDRRMGANDAMMSALFIGRPLSQGAGKIQDIEFAEMKWVTLEEALGMLICNNIYINHQPLLTAVLKRLGIDK